jgi:hypothetical protein
MGDSTVARKRWPEVAVLELSDSSMTTAMTVPSGITIGLASGRGVRSFLAASGREESDEDGDEAEEGSLDADCWSADFWHPVRPRNRATLEINTVENLRFI